MGNSLKNFSKLAIIFLLIVLTFRLQYILTRISYKRLYSFSSYFALFVCFFFPKSKREIIDRFRKSELFNEKDLKFVYKKYITNLFYDVFLLLMIVYAKKKKVSKLIDYNNLEILIEKYFQEGEKKIIVAASHFHQLIILLAISQFCVSNNMTGAVTFSLKEFKLFRNFQKKLKSRFNYESFNTINVDYIEGNSEDVFEKINSSHAILVFGDVRFKSKESDSLFQINKLDAYTNNGLSKIFENSQKFQAFYTSSKMNEDRTYSIVIHPIESYEEYQIKLIEDIKNRPLEWNQWFHSPIF